jgi:hypothetical protein
MSRFNDISMRTLALTEPSVLPAIDWSLVAKQLNMPFAFIRNISDAVIVTKDKAGKSIPDSARDAWSSEQYDHFGVYSSFNGALAAWATIVNW